MKDDTFDHSCLAEPADAQRVRARLDKATGQSPAVSAPAARSGEPRRSLGPLLGASPRMQEVYRLVELAASTSAPVLIWGETGTGKELVARTIHDLSGRAAQPFVAVNCAAVPESLLESELFGYERGAFTGATERRAGYFELAQGGTVLLDEIAEMRHGLQAKYLRALQDGAVRRLGAREEIKIDVRVMTATNRDIERAMRGGGFREDLYYRINVLNIPLPPLRCRMEDIPALVDAFRVEANHKYGRDVRAVDSTAIKRLCQHAWPGNVRELRNVVERAVIVCPGRSIPARWPFFEPAGPAGTGSGRPAEVILPLGTSLEDGERTLILKTLASVNDNKTSAARILGISVKTLHNKLRRWRLARSEALI